MSKNKIYEHDSLYSFLRPFVDWCTKRSYRKIEVAGRENLPKDGAILLAPNHCNTLMDAMVMLQADKGSTVFGARADMFNNKMVAKIMFFLRILPMVRQRDGLRNVLKNHESTETIVETLEHSVPFCMFPEGRHRPARSIQPLGKGIARAAVTANERFGKEKNIYIVPVGIEYGDYFRYRNTCLITYGKPINVTEFINGLDVENEVQIMDPLRKELKERMSQLITYIPDDENLKNKWSLTKILALGRRSINLTTRLNLNRRMAADIEAAMEKHPEQMAALLEEVGRFEQERKKAGVSIFSFKVKNVLSRCLWKGLIAILGLPYFIFSLIACLPMWVLSTYLRSRIKDKAFGNTVSFGIKLGLGATWYPIIIALGFIFAPWQYALIGAILVIPTYNCVYDYNEFCRRLISDCRLIGKKNLKNQFRKIRADFAKLK